MSTRDLVGRCRWRHSAAVMQECNCDPGCSHEADWSLVESFVMIIEGNARLPQANRWELPPLCPLEPGDCP